jgi:negative regulator of flagellin synthesis FlgM
VSLTQTAAELLQLETQLRELPGIDSARVESIRQSIDDGSYQIDTSSLVDSLLQSETELGG